MAWVAMYMLMSHALLRVSRFYVTSVGGHSNEWVVVMSKMEGVSSFTSQVYQHGSTFPSQFMSDKWAQGYWVTELVATLGGEWFVAMSKTSGDVFAHQEWRSESDFPKSWVQQGWDNNMFITDAAYDGGTWYVLMSNTTSGSMPSQNWATRNDFPNGTINTGYENNRVRPPPPSPSPIMSCIVLLRCYSTSSDMTVVSFFSVVPLLLLLSAAFCCLLPGVRGYDMFVFVVLSSFWQGVTELTWTGSVWLVVMTELWFESGSWVQRQYWENAWPAYQVYEDWGKSGVSPSGAGLWITEVGVTSTQYGVVATTLTPLPDAFESTSAFSLTPAILDQEECGSCWAFAAVEAFADRLQVSGQVTETVVLSPQVLVSCSTQDDGCDGGWDARAWDYLVTHGTTTCTDACTEGCVPYSSGSCVEGHDPAHDGCEKCTFSVSCVNNNPWPVRYIAASSRSLPSGETFLQEEIRTNGPVETCFSLYHNFYTWDWDLNPVYTTTDNSSSLGGHCVKIMGWGVYVLCCCALAWVCARMPKTPSSRSVPLRCAPPPSAQHG